MLLCVSDNEQALCLRRIFNLCLVADKILFIGFEKYDVYAETTIFIHNNLQKHHIKQLIPKPDKVLIFPPLKPCGKNSTMILSISDLEKHVNCKFTARQRSQLNINFFMVDPTLFETSVMESILRIPGFLETFKPPQRVKKVKFMQCIGCHEERVDLVMLNCGHECMCQKCASQWDVTCPMCREKIKLIIY